MLKKNKKCFFKENNLKHVDFRDTHILIKFTDSHGRVLSRKRTGVSSSFQRKLDKAIKRARYMALLPYIKQ